MPRSESSVGPIVSASQLADGAMPELSELEYALTIAHNAFSRWVVHGMGAAGYPGMSTLEVQVLHSTNHRDREKTLGELCLMLNIEDTHLISYAIRKLVTLKLVATGKRGKEKTVAITDEGMKACQRYKEVREALLTTSVLSLGLKKDDVSGLANLLRTLSGQYDQAGRGAISL